MKTLKKPTRFELLVDRFLESDLAMYIGGAIVGSIIISIFVKAFLCMIER